VNRAGLLGRAGILRVAMAVVALGTMGPLCWHDFLLTWDDAPTIARNEHFNPPTLGGIGYYWGHSNMGLYVPVTYTAWGGLAYVARVDQPDETGVSLNPWVYHAANVVVHVVNSLLVLEILGVLMGVGWGAAVGAMVFAVHPVQVEAVAWAAGMKDLLCGMFSLVAVWQYLVGVQNAECRMQNEGGGDGWRLGVAAGAMVVGQLCKPTAMVVPLVAAAIDGWVIGRPWRKVIVSAGVLLVVAVPGMVVARWIQRATSISIVPVWQRVFVAGDALAFYLWKVVWPAGLALDYGRRPRWVMGHWWGYVTWVAPAAVAVVLWAGRRRWRWLVGAWVVLVAGVLPVLGLSPFLFQHYSTVTDHYLYLSMLGVAMAAAWGAEALRRWSPRGAGVVCGVVVGVLGGRAMVEGAYWTNDLTVWRRNLEVNPRSFAAENNLGMALQMAGDVLVNRGQRAAALELYREAEGHFRRADGLLPGFSLAKQNVAMALAKQGRVEESITMIEESVRTAEGSEVPPDMRANYDEALVTLGQVQMNRGKYGEAKRYFEEALRKRPGWEAAERGVKDAEAKMRGAATRGGATGPANGLRP